MAELDGIVLFLSELKFKEKEVGYIAEEGLAVGGSDPEFTELVAAQLRATVKKALKKAGTIEIDFKMFELKAQNCVDLMGGTATGGVYHAPNTPVTLEGPAEIKAVTGQIIKIPKATLFSKPAGTLGGDDPLSLDCKLTIMYDGENSPYTIDNNEPTGGE